MVDKAPSAWKIEKALAAWRDAVQIETSSTDPDHEPVELPPPSAKVDADIMEILHSILLMSGKSRALSDMADARAKALSERAKRFDARETKLRQVATDLMATIGIKSHEFYDLTVSLGKAKRHVIVTDAERLNPEYRRVTTSPDKTKIACDMNQGVIVDGAEWSNDAHTLTIRTK